MHFVRAGTYSNIIPVEVALILGLTYVKKRTP